MGVKDDVFTMGELIGLVVYSAGMIRENGYGTQDAWLTCVVLAERCVELRRRATGGEPVPGDLMPWDAGNDQRVYDLCAAIVAQDREAEASGDSGYETDLGWLLPLFADAVRLAEVVTMTDTGHIGCEGCGH